MWIKSSSAIRPIELDETSSKVFNYARRNIREVVKTDSMGTHTMFEYEENKILKSEWNTYLEIFYNTLKNDENAENIVKTTEASNIAFVVLSEDGQIDDVTASEHAYIFSEWQPDQDYTVGQLRRYGDTLYRCLTAHTAQEGWTPDVSPSLWVRTSNPADEWPEWSQPIGATDAYMKGDKVTYEGKHYVSDYDNNTWSPATFGWTEVTE